MSLQRVIEQYNIHLDEPQFQIKVPFEIPTTWPAGRKHIVQVVLELGQTRDDEYKNIDPLDDILGNSPWREKMLDRAKRIVKAAENCAAELKNEAGWRESLEHLVLAQLSRKVACRNCCGRVWRSEKEVDPACVTDEDAAERLRRRQGERARCVCGPDEPQDGAGLLIGHCAEDAIAYPDDVKSALAKLTMKPDRVHGLRGDGRRLKRLLSQRIAGKRVADIIPIHPFINHNHPVHFPFIVLEAKSEKGTGSLKGAAQQSAFAIWKLLDNQDKLRIAAKKDDDGDTDPLVWFISNKGKDWRVCIAYIETHMDCKHYLVRQVWLGHLDRLSDALQLLLIVHYIVDWAIDMYREEVIWSLGELHALDPELRQLSRQHTDLATLTRAATWVKADQHQIEPEEQPTDTGVKDVFRLLDMNRGVVRDIRYTRFRFVGLHITQDNLGAFLKSTSSQQQSKELVSSLLDHLRNAWRVKGGTLTALESDWTGKDRGLECRAQEANFLVVATVLAYLTTDWEQTREFSYISVEEGAFGRLLEYAGQRMEDGAALSDLPFVEKAAFCDVLLALRQQPAQANLLACISRVCLSSGMLSPEHETRLEAISVQSPDILSCGTDTVLKRDTVAKRDLVRGIYTKYKVGRHEPICLFLRVSSVLDKLYLPPDALPRSPGRIEHARWLKQQPDMPEAPDSVLIATSSSPIPGPSAAGLCLFVTDIDAVFASGSRSLEPSEPPWTFRVATHHDNEHDGSERWNHELENHVQRATKDNPILPHLIDFQKALDTLAARPPRRQVRRKNNGKASPGADNDTGPKTWSPSPRRQVNNIPSPESPPGGDGPYAPRTPDIPRASRDSSTPRLSVESPTPKGRQSVTVLELDLDSQADGDGSPRPPARRLRRLLFANLFTRVRRRQ